MMKLKRIGTATVTAVAALAVVAGCGTAQQEVKPEPSAQAGQTGQAGAAGSNSKKLDISVSYFNIGQAFTNRDADQYLKFMEDKFNVRFVDKVISYSDYKEKYQLWSASSELPDVFSHDIINSETYFSWIKQGIIRPLPDNLSKYPNVQKVLSLPDTKSLKVDGKTYMIPRQTYRDSDSWAMEKSLIVRKDWMDKLKIKDPATYEEYLSMLKAFAKNDPDGNGKNDTVGVTFRSSSMMSALAAGSFPNILNGSWVKENGQYIPYYASDKMKEPVKQLRQMFEEGAIDPDFAIMKTNDGIEKFGQGKVGAISMQATPNGLGKLDAAWKKYNKDVAFEDIVKVIPVTWAAADGNQYWYTAVTFWSESYFSSEVDDEKMDRILQIYDYLLSDPFRIDKQYGIEAKDYKKEGDKFVITREKDEKGQYKSIGALYPSFNLFGGLAAWGQELEYVENEVNNIQYGVKLSKLSREMLKHRIETFKPVPTNFAVEQLYTPAKSKLSAINPSEDLTRVMLGKEDPLAMWEAIVKGYENKGLSQAIKEVNEEVRKQGLDQ
jgi:putative aldouronate transport system substrate-binding protein